MFEISARFYAGPNFFFHSVEVTENRASHHPYTYGRTSYIFGARRGSSEAKPNWHGAPRQGLTDFAEIRRDTDPYHVYVRLLRHVPRPLTYVRCDALTENAGEQEQCDTRISANVIAKKLSDQCNIEFNVSIRANWPL
ncbi:hypothetical protein B0H11DRAFT_1938899 [Mycena galericulata]|nr:hypothetical protein B0H11DRAFT_1938899 [Mycena galericulata]